MNLNQIQLGWDDGDGVSLGNVGGSGFNIEILDADNNKAHKADLMTYGGKQQVPCLRIPNPDKEDKWLYESDDIIDYLKEIILQK